MMRRFSLFFLIITISVFLTADTFKGHYRVREPEMTIIDDGYDSPRYGGPVAEIIELALSRIGCSVEWTEVPWIRTINEAKAGDVDLLPRHSMDKERERFLLPIIFGYEYREVYFFIAPGKDIEINSYDDLYKFEIGQIKGAFYFDEYNTDKLIRKKDFRNFRQIAKMLESGRLEAAIAFKGGGLREYDKIEGIQRAGYVKQLPNGRYFSIPRTSPMAKWYHLLSGEIYKMRVSGEISKIYEKYGVVPYKQRFDTPESLEQEMMVR